MLVCVCGVKGSWYEGGGHYWRALLWRFHSHWWTHWHHQGACSVVQGATAAASCTFDSSQVTVTKPRSDFLTHIKFSRAATVSTAHSPQLVPTFCLDKNYEIEKLQNNSTVHPIVVGPLKTTMFTTPLKLT